MTTLVIDTGEQIVGIYSVEDLRYLAYRGSAIADAIQRIQAADEIVTYNGKNCDLRALGAMAGRNDGLPLRGVHTDMRSICWSDRIWGRSLRDTYFMHFPDDVRFPETYEGNVESDVYMTWQLWELWRRGELKVLDGQRAT